MFKKILVGLDGNDSSIKALDYAVHLARQDKAELVIVTAVEPIPPIAFGEAGGPTYIAQYQEDLHNSLKRMQDERLEKIKMAYPDLEVKGEVKDGRAAHIIKEAAKDVDLIVIGHRGGSGVLSWILGSVAKEVVDQCTVPVLIVKDKDYC